MEAGAVDYLPKPFEASELLAVVRRALEAQAGAAEENRS
jgi:DNA-binding response OmpR family regulator